MKIILIIILFTVLLISAHEMPHNPPLEVLEDEYPRAFFFRSSEHIGLDSYSQWSKNYGYLMGIEGKVLDEEIPGRSNPNITYFNRFKQEHPNQLVLLHFNGNARSPEYETESFFAGHWLYYNGAKIMTDIRDNEEITDIKVSDPTLFKTNIGRFENMNEDIGLCGLDTTGKPDWYQCEQVKLLSIDYKDSTIRVKRGCYGTIPRYFRAGQSYAASHVSSGPWCDECHLLWFYNYSLEGPRDSSGKSCAEKLAQDISKRFLSGGELEYFDGIEFDVTFANIRKHYSTFRDYLPVSNRAPDTNADGVSDDGIFNGINAYGEGVMLFLRNLRYFFGDSKLILADGNETSQQRAFGIINGIESEGWPFATDPELDGWSGGINRHLFWDQNAKRYKMNYINHKWSPKILEKGQVPFHVNRLVIAAACLTNSAIALNYIPKNRINKEDGFIWDELIMGQENRKAWLGKPVGPAIHLAKQTSNLLENYSNKQLLSMIKPSKKDEITVSEDRNMIKIEQKAGSSENMEFILSDVPCKGTDLTVFITCTADPLEKHSPEMKRAFYVTPVIPGNEIKEKSYYSYAGQDAFESVFYYPDIHQEKIGLKILVEGGEPMWIHKIEVYAHPDAMARNFEHGVILANPAAQPYEFDLKELFGDHDFRRLKGSSSQDTITNDGSMAKNVVKLNGKDALFLIKNN